MPKNSVQEWDTTASNNTDVGGIGIQGTNAVSNFDNGLRTVMSQIATYVHQLQQTATTIAALKAIDTTKFTFAFLTVAGKEGVFKWTTGDYDDEITADTTNAVYVKADAIAATSGAWIRDNWEELDPHWFGCVGDGTTDDTTAFQAVIDFIEDLQPERKVIALGNARYLISTVTIPEDCLQLTIYGNGPYSSQILSSTVTAGQVLLVYAQGCQFKDFRLQNDSFDVSAVARHGVVLTKDYGVAVPDADIDAEFHNVEVSRFQRGISCTGRGLRVENSLFSVSLYPIYLDWPDVGDYTEGGDPVQEDEGGFRGIQITDNRFHSNTSAAVANIGTNAAKINGFQICDNLVDIGRPVFYGHMGTGGSLISGNVINETPLEGINLTGGSDYLIIGNTIAGSEGLSVDRIPDNFIKLTGDHDSGVIMNNLFKRCNNHGIDIRTGTATNMVISNNTFLDPCRSVSTFSPVAFVGANHTGVVKDNVIITSNSLLGVVRGSDASASILTITNRVMGATVPDFVGSGQNANRGTLGSVASPYEKIYVNMLGIIDATTTPANESGVGNMWISGTDGDLKIKFGDNTVKVIVSDT